MGGDPDYEDRENHIRTSVSGFIFPDDMPQRLEKHFKAASLRFDEWFPTVSNSAIVTSNKDTVKGLLGVDNV